MDYILIDCKTLKMQAYTTGTLREHNGLVAGFKSGRRISWYGEKNKSTVAGEEDNG